MGDIYITRTELRSDPYSISLDDADNKYLEILQDLTKDMVDKFCQQDFSLEGTEASPVEKMVSGTGKDTVFLPKRLVTLSKVRIYSQSNVYTEYTADNFVAKQKFISWSIFSEVFESFRYRIEDFPVGKYNIGVLGTWGWSSVPNAIKYLQGKLVQKLIADKTLAQKFSSENIGDYSYNNQDNDYMVTGDYELDLIIQKYRVWGLYGTY